MMRFQSALIALVVLTASMVIADEILDESKAIAKIELLGGKVTRDEALPGRPVIEVDFHRSKRFNDRYVHLLKSFTSLRSLNLYGIAITDCGLKEIGKLPNLADLCLYRTQITDEGLKELKKSLPTTFVYEDTSEEGKTISTIERLGGWVVRDHTLPSHPVIGVTLKGCKKFNDTHIDLLKSFTCLTTLNLSATDITDVGLSEISELQGLTDLNLWNTQVTDTGLDELHRLKNLCRLNLGATKISVEGLNKIGKLNNLTNLDLDYTMVTDVGLVELKALNHLTRLDLSSTTTTKSGGEKLKESLPNLEIVR
jgi:internalin A